jgi:CubicO group peptidase (beta-lactamase class C family)
VLADGNSEPVVRSTKFHVGSIAKSVAALLIVHAARGGFVDLDAPCDQQAPGLWPDTPRAIMAQTTGRQNVLPDIDEDIESLVARVLAMPPVHPAGRFSYCNSGWSVLDLLLRHRPARPSKNSRLQRFSALDSLMYLAPFALPQLT